MSMSAANWIHRYAMWVTQCRVNRRTRMGERVYTTHERLANVKHNKLRFRNVNDDVMCYRTSFFSLHLPLDRVRWCIALRAAYTYTHTTTQCWRVGDENQMGVRMFSYMASCVFSKCCFHFSKSEFWNINAPRKCASSVCHLGGMCMLTVQSTHSAVTIHKWCLFLFSPFVLHIQIFLPLHGVPNDHRGGWKPQTKMFLNWFVSEMKAVIDGNDDYGSGWRRRCRCDFSLVLETSASITSNNSESRHKSVIN